jgi:hypothetical protein
MLIPDEVAEAARRLAAKMVADQAAPLMFSITGISNEGELQDHSALVIVAHAGHKISSQLYDFIKSKSTRLLTDVVDRRDGCE